MNVLLSCVGRRGYLVRYFQEALAGRGKVIVTNSAANASGMLAADEAVVMPPLTDPAYPELVIELCRKRNIGLLCSLFDLDLAVLAPLRDRFEAVGTRLAVSSPSVIDICFDKWKTVQFSQKLGLDSPKTYLTTEAALTAVSDGEIFFPLIVKPRWGTGSIAVETAYDADDLCAIRHHVQKVIRHTYLASAHSDDCNGGVIIQEMLRGTEYGVDIVNDLSGDFACCFMKQKLGMRSGETDAAITVEDGEIEAMARQISARLRHVGLLDMDIIRGQGRSCLLEMNPRFGGHYPFSHLAGANIPAALIAWAQGEDADPAWLRVMPGVEGYKDINPCLRHAADAGTY